MNTVNAAVSTIFCNNIEEQKLQTLAPNEKVGLVARKELTEEGPVYSRFTNPSTGKYKPIVPRTGKFIDPAEVIKGKDFTTLTIKFPCAKKQN